MFLSFNAFSQKNNLFESIEYKIAYQNGTRVRTGLPGENYWQNRSDYVINANFNPETKIITGHLQVTYYNESPDSLNSMVLKLMQNVYKKGAVRQMEVDEKILHEGIKIEQVMLDGKSLQDNAIKISGTVMRLTLPKAIHSKSSGILELDFITPMPTKAGYRSGTIDSTSFFIAYWFPQMAVYDDIFGWDTDEYVGIPENYNDFSNYEVSLTLPSQYNIWATGEHINAKEIFSPEIVKRIEQSKKDSKSVKIIDENDFRKADGKNKTWFFKAKDVPDFAWGTSDHFVWEGMAANNPTPKKTCWVQTVYPIGANNFDWAINISKNSIELFSKEFPGIPYPYFKHITFRGTEGGGMEFPMVANNDIAYDSTNTVLVTAHELAHNYFPFMMGVNERKYGWWDETMTTLMESYLKERIYPEQQVHGFYNRKVSFNYLAADHDILPLMTETSSMMKVMPSITNFYVKGPAAMDMLMELIGKEKFYEINKAFMNAWKGKHPTPYDYFYFFNTLYGENLNWFWDACFFSFGYPDLAISDASQNNEYLIIKIQNVGGWPIPFLIDIEYIDGTKSYETFKIDIWKSNPELTTIQMPANKKVESVSIDGRYSYESNPENNNFILK